MSTLHARAAREAAEEDLSNTTKLHTGSQWVIIDRAFSTYLVTSPAAASWMRVFERRFLSDEGFLHTALMHSPHRHTLVNTNLRYIMWPHHHGDPTSYWASMGVDSIGGPEIINASEAPKVRRSPLTPPHRVCVPPSSAGLTCMCSRPSAYTQAARVVQPALHSYPRSSAARSCSRAKWTPR